MSNAVSPPQEPAELKAALALVWAADEGKLDGLSCPRCGKATVSVWFTVSVVGEYRTWFLCSACDFEMRAQNSGKPKHYSAARDRTAAGEPVV